MLTSYKIFVCFDFGKFCALQSTVVCQSAGTGPSKTKPIVIALLILRVSRTKTNLTEEPALCANLKKNMPCLENNPIKNEPKSL